MTENGARYSVQAPPPTRQYVEATPEPESVAVIVTVTEERYQPLEPEVPLRLEDVSGGVVSGGTTLINKASDGMRTECMPSIRSQFPRVLPTSRLSLIWTMDREARSLPSSHTGAPTASSVAEATCPAELSFLKANMR